MQFLGFALDQPRALWGVGAASAPSDAAPQMLFRPEKQDGHMARGGAELLRDILARNFVDQTQPNDPALHLA